MTSQVPEIAPLTLLCAKCHRPTERVDVVDQNDQGPRLEFYQCQQAGCETVGRLAVMFERDKELGPPEKSFVEREVARRGAFYPADVLGGRRTPRNW